jgi:hypothetical protein
MNTTRFAECFQLHIQQHTLAEPQDAVKFCHQAAMGAEHLLTDKEQAMRYFLDEYEGAVTADVPPFEPLSEAYSRVHLGAWKQLGLPPLWLFNMFYHTATEPSPGETELLQRYLNAVEQCAKAGVLPFSLCSWQTYRKHYEARGHPPVRHSPAYRQKESPAYRVVKAEYERLLPVLQQLTVLPQTHCARIMAIDGRAAAGKTTSAALLAEVLDAAVIHMDDFFLPPELRTSARLAEPGGNVHYERFISEVLPCLRNPEGFSYRCFDCSNMAYGRYREVPPSAWRIVEGSYSCHPAFGEYMDLRVFCDVTSDEQLRRIVSRNGRKTAAVFSTKWIPMEEQYFAAARVKEMAHVVL